MHFRANSKLKGPLFHCPSLYKVSSQTEFVIGKSDFAHIMEFH